tara:strand:+ start:311 stop:478 length:168 start_codon:yes stop_codon:yes gene_type:complete
MRRDKPKEEGHERRDLLSCEVADLQNIVVLNLAPGKCVCLRVTDKIPAFTWLSPY